MKRMAWEAGGRIFGGTIRIAQVLQQAGGPLVCDQQINAGPTKLFRGGAPPKELRQQRLLRLGRWRSASCV
eukprot:CAMPEP_0177686340 /NCGR_PEP_ID=MMETSP0447-20121125/33513_1 /TAXON_ID=0 /ORGANISM="Stygamoeba regulata, Strain BSH-02190019" /LENGTH=70 /DNA_ID=CAMNT_0019196449 /DNA_START=287 /DNA_END=495 /DNA_ORIENTATION=-